MISMEVCVSMFELFTSIYIKVPQKTMKNFFNSFSKPQDHPNTKHETDPHNLWHTAQNVYNSNKAKSN